MVSPTTVEGAPLGPTQALSTFIDCLCWGRGRGGAGSRGAP